MSAWQGLFVRDLLLVLTLIARVVMGAVLGSAMLDIGEI